MRSLYDSLPFSRRRLLTGAALAPFATVARRGDAQVQTLNVNPRGTARSCIFFNLNGAPSHVDTFDVKDGPWNPPDADLRQYSGGIVLSRRLFPQLSRLSGDLLLLRSVQSWEAAHERGQFYLQTAHPANPAFVAETPHIGAVVGLERGQSGTLPPFISLNNGQVLQGSKFLGGQYEPMAAPSNPGGLTTLEHPWYGNQSQARFEEKYKLLLDLDRPLRDAPPSKEMADHAAYYQTAKRLMYDAAIASVFRFSTDVNQRYGDSNVGRSAVVARNAVRANNGTVFLVVNSYGWDTHQNMYDTNYTPNMYSLCNELDTAVGALVDDLKASGDFGRTLIVIMGEFGRTPGLLNPRGGRDHHRYAMSVALLGGGIRGGRVLGATDSTGEKITDAGWSEQRPIVMEDIAATMYSALGINWSKSLTDTPSGRKFEYVPGAMGRLYTSIDEVFG